MNILPHKYFRKVFFRYFTRWCSDILRCGGIFKYEFVANLPMTLPVKEFGKSVNIWERYGQEFSVFVF